MAFKAINPQVNFVELEKQILEKWYFHGIVAKYLNKNKSSSKKFSFLDGPITANNPMGVHHAWGRTYKDLWQRYHTMKGEAGRYQNGFDCQGLWVEVEVEKELGFKNKKDIEAYGIDKFVEKCKERVMKYAAIQTEQSKRLGYFMDWDNSYYTMSDQNNYAIWGFLQECWRREWIYQGHDVVPWCPRCETAISQHEILGEDYKELTHESVYLQFPIIGRDRECLLIWTTTPWTLPANTAVAVDQKLSYSLVDDGSGNNYWVCNDLIEKVFAGKIHKVIKTVPGKKLLGLKYISPFDHLPVIAKALSQYPDKMHTVVPSDPLLMPISIEEGTGLVHTSTSTGEEDFKLGKKLGLPVVPAISDNASYLEGFGELTGKNAKKDPHLILDHLRPFAVVSYTHRYPACWRCKTELVWKVADEWYISMDCPDPTDTKKRSLRKQLIANAKKIHWLPGFGLGRELDWLTNMHDWLISKKNRYWGLALPIYKCPSCGHFEIIGSKKELQSRAVSGWDKFDGHSPHRPWIDEVKISCPKCQVIVDRISDVGNPWLDAGIVSISTMPESWYPADFITESFPGQFKNWFYSLIVMATVLRKTPPFKNVLGFATVLAEDGREMHKSLGNSIEFNQAADQMGVDVARWIYVSQNPQDNLLFGYKLADETRRRFHLTLWNVFNFFVTYANIDNFSFKNSPEKTTLLDSWILARLNQTISGVSGNLDQYNAYLPAKLIEEFVGDLSLWYVRRSRSRIGPTVPNGEDKINCYSTLYTVLIKLTRILAPFLPYISEEIYTTLSSEESVHLSEWPDASSLTASDLESISRMQDLRKIVELALAERKKAQIKVRQPLNKITIFHPNPEFTNEYEQLLKDEVNLKKVVWNKSPDLRVEIDTNLTPELIAEGNNRELIRQVQELRKTKRAGLSQPIRLTAPLPLNQELRNQLQLSTLAQELVPGDLIEVELL